MNRRKKIILLFSLFLLSVSVVAALSILTQFLNRRKNNFIRRFPPHSVSLVQRLDIGHTGFYFAGLGPGHIYLANYADPGLVVSADYALRDTTHRRIHLQDTTKLIRKGLRTLVNFPHAYLTEGTTPSVLYSPLDSLNFQRLPVAQPRFNLAFGLSPSSLVFRSFDTRLGQNILVKKSLAPDGFIRNEQALTRQIDGLFCTDGVLLYNKPHCRFVYVYCYRNQFICLDTNLNIVYKEKTIDSISTAKIQLGKIPSEGSQTFSAPPLRVNKAACTDGKALYILSGLAADNEDLAAFRNNSVIDVYALVDGRYKFSFYLPRHGKEKVQEFRVTGKTLLALYNTQLYRFELKF